MCQMTCKIIAMVGMMVASAVIIGSIPWRNIFLIIQMLLILKIHLSLSTINCHRYLMVHLRNTQIKWMILLLILG